MKPCLLLLLILLASGAAGQDRSPLIGKVEFFGYAGVDTNKLREALPFHERDKFVWETFAEQLDPTGEAVKRVTGRYPTDMANVCCDERGDRVIFIGLAGSPARHNPPPRGHARLPDEILNLYDQYLKLNEESVLQRTAAEDDSKGYALSGVIHNLDEADPEVVYFKRLRQT